MPHPIFLTLVLFFARWLATFVKRAAHHEKVIASASQTTHFFCDEKRPLSSHFEILPLHCLQSKKWKLTKPTKLDAPRCPCRTQFFLTLVLFFARWLATFVKRAAHHEKVIASASQTTHFFCDEKRPLSSHFEILPLHCLQSKKMEIN